MDCCNQRPNLNTKNEISMQINANINTGYYYHTTLISPGTCRVKKKKKESVHSAVPP